jgi:hypothetical protein
MQAAGIEGELRLRACWDGRSVTALEVASSRPRFARALLRGRAPADAVAMLPRLYAICGRAQGIAAALAVEAAAGEPADEDRAAARRRAVEAEVVGETLWRALVDWPRLLGEPVRAAELARARAALEAAPGEAATRVLAAEVAESSVFGGPAAGWLGMASLNEAERWAGRASTPAARWISRLSRQADPQAASLAASLAWTPPADARLAATLARAMDARPDFESAPDLDGTPAETGALARCRSHAPAAAAIAASRRVLARGLARLAELAILTSAPTPTQPAGAAGECGAVQLAPGDGLGWVETARGLLVHRARIADGRIDDYRVLAPTEWNFHPKGPLPRSVIGLAGADEAGLLEAIGLAVQALDPCVAFRVEVDRA